MSNTVTVTGNLGSDPELRFTSSGKAFVTVSVGDTPRRFNRDSNQWEDAGETLWLRCTRFGGEAEEIADKAHRGDKVTVVGRLKSRSWDDKETGQKRTAVEVEADSIAIVPKAARSAAGGAQWSGQSGAWPGSTPASPADGESPF